MAVEKAKDGAAKEPKKAEPKKAAKKNTKSAKTSTKTTAASSKSKQKQSKKSEYLTYNGKLLLRCGDQIYYGDPKDKYIVVFRLMDNDKLDDLTISRKVIIELKTNEGKASRLMRQAERDGLYKAFDIGFFWLEQALEQG